MRDRPDAVMLFAAGFGTRMGALTAQRPKPLVQVAGRALIDHALDQVRGYGPRRVVANLHYLSEQIEEHLAGQDVVFSREEPEILETGGGLRKALPLLGEGPVFTMNTDAVWAGPNPLACLAEAWAPDEMDALLLCIPKSRAMGHTGAGDFVLEPDGRAARGPGLIYSGVQILKTEGLAGVEDESFSLNRLWNGMLEERRLFGLAYDGGWCDVGTPEGIALAENMLKTGHV